MIKMGNLIFYTLAILKIASGTYLKRNKKKKKKKTLRITEALKKKKTITAKVSVFSSGLKVFFFLFIYMCGKV